MPAIQKSFNLYLALVAATLAIMPLANAHAEDEAEVEAEEYKQTTEKKEFGIASNIIMSGDPTHFVPLALEGAYRYHRDFDVSPGDTSEGNDDVNLTAQFGATNTVRGSRHLTGRARIDGAKGWVNMGFTAVESDSKRVRYLSPQIGPRAHFSDNKSYVTLLVNPIGAQMDIASGMRVARTGAEIGAHVALTDKLTLDAAGGLGILYGSGSGTGTAAHTNAALTLRSFKIGENISYLRVEAVLESNRYPKAKESLPSSESKSHVILGAAAGLAW